MTSSNSSIVQPHSGNLLPSPLRIRKKPRRASRRATIFHRRMTVLGNKSGYGRYLTCCHARRKLKKRIERSSPKTPQHVDRAGCGPLDDIISEITSDIWSAPPQSVTKGPLEDALGQQDSLKAPSTCTISTVMPLPVSRVPSNQPLKVRKHRSSRSTGSWSSATQSLMALSRISNSREATDENNGFKSLDELQPNMLPQFGCPEYVSYFRNRNFTDRHAEYASDTHGPEPKRRLSRIRLLPIGITRLLRSVSESKRLELEVQAGTILPCDSILRWVLSFFNIPHTVTCIDSP